MMAVKAASPRISMPACVIVVYFLLIVIDKMSCSTNRIIIGIVDGASTTRTSSSVSRRRGLFGRRTNHEDLIHTHDDDEYDEYSYDRFNNNFFNKNNGDNDPKVVEEEEECVTSFYTRVRAKRRALLNGPQFDSSSQLHPKPLSDDNDDIVSLTSSYCPLSSSRGVSPQGAMMDDNNHRHHHQLFDNSLVDNNNLSSDGGDSTMARSVRGGGGSSYASTARRPASRSTTSSSFWGMRPQENTDRHNSRSSSYFHTSFANGAGENNMDEEDSCFPPQEEEDELININESFQDNCHTNEDYHQHHCLGLLRVPCSIAINSGEYSSSSSSQQYHHHVKTTSVSAYVDTGAQVTVISAAAAKRAGIYHLMDRRYAGRATGVGHCRVLGRIPARHVYFLLGGNEDKQVDDDDWRDVRGGGGRNTSYDLQDKSSSSKNVMVQMDGPALTVLEGTVTKGVDVLLGLDVLQDWEAEIRMGSNKSITVREKKRRGGASVVIPFATSSTNDAGVYTARSSSSSSSRTSFYNHLDHPRRHSNNINSKANMYHATDDSMDLIEHDMDLIDSDIVEGLDVEEYDEDTDDYDDLFFSPTSTDIESDLDLLDKSGHEFSLYDDISSGSSSRRSQTSSRSSFFSGGDWAASNDDTNKIRRAKMTVNDEQEDKLSATIVRCGDGGRNNPSIIHDEKYELDDMNDDVDYDDEEKIDMSGL